MNDEEKEVLELFEKCLRNDDYKSFSYQVEKQEIIKFTQAIRDQEAAKHKAEVAELERQVAMLRERAAALLGAIVVEAKAQQSCDVAIANYDDSQAEERLLVKALVQTSDADKELRKAISDTSEIAKRHDARVKKEARKEYRNELLPLMVERFLSWKLPKNFHPDCGISFAPEYNKEYMESIGKPPARHEPMGTNLFNADQARGMVAFMLGGISDEQVDETVASLREAFGIASDELEGKK